jgi:uncharacterized membrane protein
MKAKLTDFWEDVLHSSYWFLPAIMAVLAVGLATFTIWLDGKINYQAVQHFGWVYTGGANGASTLLSAIAGSVITVAGITFSLMITALTLAASQFGSRLLRNFMRDTGNQLVLGTFTATFIYSLLVLRTVRSEEGDIFVPHISVTVSLGLAVISLGVLIYFIHHVANSIQVTFVIKTVSDDLNYSIDRLYPQRMGRDVPQQKVGRAQEEIPADFEQTARPIWAGKDGYIQAIDSEELLRLAIEHNFIVQIEHRPGYFIVKGSTLARVWPGQNLNDELASQIRDLFILGHQRTQTQDVEFDINQLVEVAIRALSPAINDPFTAMMCTDRLGAALCRLAQKDFPSRCRYDEQDNLRIITEAATFSDLVSASFNQIRQYGRGSVSVTLRLLEMIRQIAAYTRYEEQREVLRRQAIMIERSCQDAVPEEWDREAVRERFQAAMQALGTRTELSNSR